MAYWPIKLKTNNKIFAMIKINLIFFVYTKWQVKIKINPLH